MTAIVKAADLPEGSVVAHREIVFILMPSGFRMAWRGTDGSRRDHQRIDPLLNDGAIVLRHGYGEGGVRA